MSADSSEGGAAVVAWASSTNWLSSAPSAAGASVSERSAATAPSATGAAASGRGASTRSTTTIPDTYPASTVAGVSGPDTRVAVPHPANATTLVVHSRTAEHLQPM